MWATAVRSNGLDFANFQLQKVATQLIQNGREFLQSVIQRGKVAPRTKDNTVFRESVKPCTTPTQSVGSGRPLIQQHVFKGLFGQGSWQSRAADLRRQSAYRLISGLRGTGVNSSSLPLFAFVGFGLVANQNTQWKKKTEREAVCEDIRSLFFSSAKIASQASDEIETVFSLDTLKFGRLLDQGCNAAVYEAEFVGPPGNFPFEETLILADVKPLCEQDSCIPGSSICPTITDVISYPETDESIMVIREEEEDIIMVGKPSSNVDQTNEDIDALANLGHGFVMINPVLSKNDLRNDLRVSVIPEPKLDASLKDSESDILILSDEEDTSMPFDEDIPSVDSGGIEQSAGNQFGLAVKMLFNYDVESRAEAIYQAMAKETVPARIPSHLSDSDIWKNGKKAKMKSLPMHPNIVEMVGVFVGPVPDFVQEDGVRFYPAALPRRLHEDGFGRNMTMFLIMKRYDCNLQNFLSSYYLDMRCRLLLLVQLLEGVSHMAAHKIAHRDLKTDNLLVDNGTFTDCPWLAISDFGCSLAEGTLILPYQTGEICKGGNSALMAPEIKSMEPGMSSVLDYRKADLWAVGAVAYEILGGTTPFYRSAKGDTHLDSRTYTTSELPPLPEGTPDVVHHLVWAMLARDPLKRPSPDVAATVLQLFLWNCPWVVNYPTQKEQITLTGLLQWMVNFAACLYSDRVSVSAHTKGENFIKQIFLARISITSLEGVVSFLHANV